MARLFAVVCAALLLTTSAPMAAPTPLPRSYAPFLGQLNAGENRLFENMFARYSWAFIASDGSVFDPQNGNRTHSESQGYGMLLALMGNDPVSFDRIWSFARRELQRPDKLFAWSYEPGRGVVDENNATDGELLIATSLALAGMRWENGDYMREATDIANVVGEKLIIEHGGRTILLPGEWAIPARDVPDPTINLSYFIPLTLPIMEALAPQYPWQKIEDDTYSILDDLVAMPSDWTTISATGVPSPAPGYAPQFGYDAVRIPLYLLQNGVTDKKIFPVLGAIWGNPRSDFTFSFDVNTLERTDRFWGQSYELTHDIFDCLTTGVPAEWSSLESEMVNYFDSSLHMMAMGALYALYPQCFPPDELVIARP